MRCNICKTESAIWAWQPFGPDDKPIFTTLGSHYRGFPVIKVCDTCKESFDKYGRKVFDYKGITYCADHTRVWELGVPEVLPF